MRLELLADSLSLFLSSFPLSSLSIVLITSEETVNINASDIGPADFRRNRLREPLPRAHGYARLTESSPRQERDNPRRGR